MTETHRFEDDDDRWWDAEHEDSENADAELLACPSCGAEVYEETEQCPQCGEWIMPLAASARSKGWVWIVAAVAALAGLIAWMVG